MKMKKNIYKQPLTQLVKLKTTESITDGTDYGFNTSKTTDNPDEGGWAKKHDSDDFNFEKGGVGDWENKDFTDPPSWE